MFLNGTMLLYLGAALMALAFICAVIVLVILKRKRKQLDQQLELEYGPKGGKLQTGKK